MRLGLGADRADEQGDWKEFWLEEERHLDK